MRMLRRLVVAMLCTVALLSLAALGGGCGSDNGGESNSGGQSASSAPQSQWERVTTAHVSGDQPVKVYLGAYELGDQCRLAWELTGAEDPPVTLTLRIINVTNGAGYGQAITTRSEPDAVRRDDKAMVLREFPGKYRIYFSQRFRPARGPGYDIKLTIYTK
jgi:hypothetical protein